MRTRVLYVLPTLMTGGLERMVFLLASGLDRSLYRPELLSFDLAGPWVEIARNAGIPVTVEHRTGGFLDFGLVRRLAMRLRRDPVDLVHAHNATALVYATLAARLAGNVPVVYTEHDRSFPGPAQDRVLHFAAGRLADRVVTVAEWLRRALSEHEGRSLAEIDVVPNGIDAARFRIPPDEGGVRAEFELDSGAPLACCVARLVPVKNHPALLTAWRRVADVWPGATLLLVGDGAQRNEIRAHAQRLGLGHSVRFLGDRDDVPRLLGACNFHVLASLSEGMSLTLIEAMAAGKASVATAVGGNTEVLENGRTGFLVESGDVHALASRMAELIREPALALLMGIEARETFRKRFTAEAMVAGYERVYRETLSTRSHAHPAWAAQGAH